VKSESNGRTADIFNIKESNFQMLLKRAKDIEELGGKPVIIKSKFDTPVILKVKFLARENPKMAIRDFEAELVKGFPQKLIPSKSTNLRSLAQSGFQNQGNLVHLNY
jgi:hypothetical protein